jgi:hypothetical protein
MIPRIPTSGAQPIALGSLAVPAASRCTVIARHEPTQGRNEVGRVHVEVRRKATTPIVPDDIVSDGVDLVAVVIDDREPQARNTEHSDQSADRDFATGGLDPLDRRRRDAQDLGEVALAQIREPADPDDIPIGRKRLHHRDLLSVDEEEPAAPHRQRITRPPRHCPATGRSGSHCVAG